MVTNFHAFQANPKNTFPGDTIAKVRDTKIELLGWGKFWVKFEEWTR